MNKIVKDALILFAITLVAGVLLGFVYDITKDPIAAQNEKAKQEAYKEVMADADSFEALSGDAYSEANITATFVAADRKSTRLNSSHKTESRMPSSA